jgi:hypothetical protein
MIMATVTIPASTTKKIDLNLENMAPPIQWMPLPEIPACDFIQDQRQSWTFQRFGLLKRRRRGN